MCTFIEKKCTYKKVEVRKKKKMKKGKEDDKWEWYKFLFLESLFLVIGTYLPTVSEDMIDLMCFSKYTFQNLI